MQQFLKSEMIRTLPCLNPITQSHISKEGCDDGICDKIIETVPLNRALIKRGLNPDTFKEY